MSSKGNKFYEVTAHSCTCPDYVYRQAQVGGKCKHMNEHFYPTVVKDLNTQEIETFFRDGVDIDKAYNKYGEDRINELIGVGDICKSNIKGEFKFYLLE